MVIHVVFTFIFKGSLSKPDVIVYILTIFFLYFIFQNLYLEPSVLVFFQPLVLTVLYFLFYSYLKHITRSGVYIKDISFVSKFLLLLIPLFFISPTISLVSLRYSGVFFNPNFTAHTTLMVFPLILLGLNNRNKFLASFIVLALIIFLGSRSSLLAFLLGIIVLFISIKIKKGLSFLASLILLSLVLYVSWNALDLTANFTEYLAFIFNEKSHLLYEGSNGRDEIFEVSVKKWRESPYFGVGFGDAKIDIGKGIEFSSHNSLYELLLKTGMFGAIFWFLLFVVIIYKISKSSNQWTKSLALMSAAIILSLGTSSSVFFVFNYFWFYFLIIFIISQSKLIDSKTY
ncbi:O-antigen ligase family protein [Flavobacteriaceae bacterium]|nr:O-antigen ligase family protein [Flavobacteriaceae bacterium]